VRLSSYPQSFILIGFCQKGTFLSRPVFWKKFRPLPICGRPQRILTQGHGSARYRHFGVGDASVAPEIDKLQVIARSNLGPALAGEWNVYRKTGVQLGLKTGDYRAQPFIGRRPIARKRTGGYFRHAAQWPRSIYRNIARAWYRFA
jgi:hypothetical protein